MIHIGPITKGRSNPSPGIRPIQGESLCYNTGIRPQQRHKNVSVTIVYDHTEFPLLIQR